MIKNLIRLLILLGLFFFWSFYCKVKFHLLFLIQLLSFLIIINRNIIYLVKNLISLLILLTLLVFWLSYCKLIFIMLFIFLNLSCLLIIFLPLSIKHRFLEVLIIIHLLLLSQLSQQCLSLFLKIKFFLILISIISLFF